jgi:hypothetical protein
VEDKMGGMFHNGCFEGAISICGRDSTTYDDTAERSNPASAGIKDEEDKFIVYHGGVRVA